MTTKEQLSEMRAELNALRERVVALEQWRMHPQPVAVPWNGPIEVIYGPNGSPPPAMCGCGNI